MRYKCGLLFISLMAAGAAIQSAPAFDSLAELRAARGEALENTRVIFNSDGCDAWRYRGTRPVTPERFLRERTAALSDSAVDTVSYCPLSVAFGGFIHRTRVGRIMAFDNSDYGPGYGQGINATPELLMWGTDPLELVADFCRRHGMRILFSLRMNDTHDKDHNPGASRPHVHWSPFKEHNPQWLIGSRENRPPYGAWSAVNYAVPRIRELAYMFAEEACRDYDVDGIELDFFRHLNYFPTPARGGTATDEELAMMTALVREIREMTERVGMEKGRPLLVAVRVPDHQDYARALGLDFEQWMKEDLVDIVIGGGDFRLRPWDENVELCSRYGARFFAGLTDWRVQRERDFVPGMHRQSSALYRAAAMNAWAAGVDGIYSFNEYNTRQSYLKEIDDVDALRWKEKVYAVAVRTDDPGRYLAGGRSFMERKLVSPHHPVTLSADRPLEIPLRISESLKSAPGEGLTPHVQLLLQTGNRSLAAEQLEVTFNGEPLDMTRRDDKGWMTAPLLPEQVLFGWNRVGVILGSDSAHEDDGIQWDVHRIFDRRPRPPEQFPWRRLYRSADRVEEVRDGALYLADKGRGENDFPHLVYPWLVTPGEGPIGIEAVVKVVASDDPLAVCLRFADGRAVEYLTLQPEKVGLYFAGKSYAIDTTDDFHTYRVVLDDRDIRLYVDGKLRIEAPGAYNTPAAAEHALPFKQNHHWNERSILLGSASPPGQGSALWRSIRFSSHAATLRDLLVHVRYEKAAANAGGE